MSNWMFGKYFLWDHIEEKRAERRQTLGLQVQQYKSWRIWLDASDSKVSNIKRKDMGILFDPLKSARLPLYTPDFCQQFLDDFENLGRFPKMIFKIQESKGIHMVSFLTLYDFIKINKILKKILWYPLWNF